MMYNYKEISNMKKLFGILALSLSSSVFAANFVSVDTEQVKGMKGGSDSVATYVRAGKDVGQFRLGLQSRTAKFDNGNVINSLETTAGIGIGFLQPYVGVGHDFGGNGFGSFNYGLVGIQAGTKLGPGFALAGVKTRVRADDNDPNQTITYATYSLPVTKQFSVNVNASRSTQTINERAVGVGLTFNY